MPWIESPACPHSTPLHRPQFPTRPRVCVPLQGSGKAALKTAEGKRLQKLKAAAQSVLNAKGDDYPPGKGLGKESKEGKDGSDGAAADIHVTQHYHATKKALELAEAGRRAHYAAHSSSVSDKKGDAVVESCGRQGETARRRFSTEVLAELGSGWRGAAEVC